MSNQQSLPIPEFCGKYHFIKFYVLPNIEVLAKCFYTLNTYFPKTGARKISYQNYREYHDLFTLALKSVVEEFNYWNFTDEKFRSKFFGNRYLIGKALLFAFMKHSDFWGYRFDNQFDNNNPHQNKTSAGSLANYFKNTMNLPLQYQGAKIFQTPRRYALKEVFATNYVWEKQNSITRDTNTPTKDDTKFVEAKHYHISQICQSMFEYLSIYKKLFGVECQGYEFFLTLSKEYQNKPMPLLQESFFKDLVKKSSSSVAPFNVGSTEEINRNAYIFSENKKTFRRLFPNQTADPVEYKFHLIYQQLFYNKYYQEGRYKNVFLELILPKYLK